MTSISVGINYLLTLLFDGLFYPFASINPAWGLFFISVITGIVMLYIFKLTSNQEGIKATKEKIKAFFYEIRIYQHDLKQTLEAQKGLMLTNFTYMKYSLKPMLVMIIPVIIILIQLNFRYSYRPLKPGEQAIIKVFAAEEVRNSLESISLELDPGLKLSAGSIKINELGEVDWRLQATQRGIHSVKVKTPQGAVTVTIPVNDELTRVYPQVMKGTVLDSWLYPGNSFLADDAPIDRIEIQFPEKHTPFFSIDIHWLISFFILSVVGGYSLKGPFGVEI